MMNEYETIKKDNKILRIFYDEDSESPREFMDNFGVMVYSHRNYKLGDEELNTENFNGWEEIKEYLIKEKKAVCVLPLFLYDHSGITIKTTPFGCRWDSGQVGFIYTTEEKIKEFGIKEKNIKDFLEGEVKTFDEYIKGEVYGYTLTEEIKVKITREYEDGRKETTETIEEKDLDSCWNYWGEEGLKQIKEECGFE